MGNDTILYCLSVSMAFSIGSRVSEVYTVITTDRIPLAIRTKLLFAFITRIKITCAKNKAGRNHRALIPLRLSVV